jgi:hypothetical protein
MTEPALSFIATSTSRWGLPLLPERPASRAVDQTDVSRRVPSRPRWAGTCLDTTFSWSLIPTHARELPPSTHLPGGLVADARPSNPASALPGRRCTRPMRTKRVGSWTSQTT